MSDSYFLLLLGLANDFVKSQFASGSERGELDGKEREQKTSSEFTSRAKITKENIKLNNYRLSGLKLEKKVF